MVTRPPGGPERRPAAAVRAVAAAAGEHGPQRPVLAHAHEDQGAMPLAAQLKAAISQAKPRPVSPVYPLISEAIYKNVNRALSGEATPEAALKAADQGITKALATF